MTPDPTPTPRVLLSALGAILLWVIGLAGIAVLLYVAIG